MKHIILFLLIIMMLIPTAVSCTPKDDTLTSDLGINRDTATQNGWRYYRHPDGIYKIRTNGEDKTLILSKIPRVFSVYEDRVYYIPYDENISRLIATEEDYIAYISLYSCSTDGGDDQVICETQLDLGKMDKMQIRVVDGWIFIGFKPDELHADYDLYRMRIDDTELTMISQTDDLIFDFSIDNDGWIYYITAGELEDKPVAELCRMGYDGIVKQQLMQEVAWAMDYSDNEIFYIGEYGENIYAVSYTETYKRKVVECEASTSFFKVIGDWVYYIDVGDDPGLYKFKTDGSDRRRIPVLSWPSYTRATVVDNWLTYLSEDRESLEMIRISDTHDTDALLDQIRTEVWEVQIRELSERNTDDPIEQMIIDSYIDRYENFEIRKYE